MKKLTQLSIYSIFLLASSISFTGYAQSTSEGVGGSAYSIYGIGYPQDITAHNFKGQGLLGVSGISREITSLSNPAVWSSSFFSQASTGLDLNNHSLETTLETGKNSSLSPGYLQLLLPVSPGRLGVSLSLYPVTRSDFRVIDTQEFTINSEPIVSTNEIQSSGGINKFEAGFGIKITDYLSFGYAPAIAFMTIENSESLLFDFDSGSLGSQDQRLDITGATFSQRFGIAANFKDFLRRGDRIAFGATLSLPYTLNASSKFTSDKVVEGTVQTIDLTSTIDNTSGGIDVPLETSFGIGYGPSRFLNLAFEGSFQQWSNFKNELNPSEELFFKDRLKIGLGGQFHPYKRNSPAFLSNFKYSAGVSYDTGHLTIEGNDINTLWINTGLGIIARNAAPIDISFQYGFRGTTDNNLIKERIWSLGFSLNLNELMFIRPKLK